MCACPATGIPAAPDDDLRALAAEISATTGAPARAADQLAAALRPSLRRYASQWDADADHARSLAAQRDPRARPRGR